MSERIRHYAVRQTKRGTWILSAEYGHGKGEDVGTFATIEEASLFRPGQPMEESVNSASLRDSGEEGSK